MNTKVIVKQHNEEMITNKQQQEKHRLARQQ